MTIVLVIAYALIINMYTFALMGYDKRKAVRRGRRIAEKQLFAAAALGGALGGIAGMRVWRHKTKHRSFSIGFPVLLLIQIGILTFLFCRKNSFLA